MKDETRNYVEDKIANAPEPTADLSKQLENMSKESKAVDESASKAVVSASSLSIDESDLRNSKLVSVGLSRLASGDNQEDKDLATATGEATAVLFSVLRNKYGLWGLLGGAGIACGIGWGARLYKFMQYEKQKGSTKNGNNS